MQNKKCCVEWCWCPERRKSGLFRFTWMYMTWLQLMVTLIGLALGSIILGFKVSFSYSFSCFFFSFKFGKVFILLFYFFLCCWKGNGKTKRKKQWVVVNSLYFLFNLYYFFYGLNLFPICITVFGWPVWLMMKSFAFCFCNQWIFASLI